MLHMKLIERQRVLLLSADEWGMLHMKLRRERELVLLLSAAEWGMLHMKLIERQLVLLLSAAEWRILHMEFSRETASFVTEWS